MCITCNTSILSDPYMQYVSEKNTEQSVRAPSVLQSYLATKTCSVSNPYVHYVSYKHNRQRTRSPRVLNAHQATHTFTCPTSLQVTHACTTCVRPYVHQVSCKHTKPTTYILHAQQAARTCTTCPTTIPNQPHVSWKQPVRAARAYKHTKQPTRFL